MTEKEIKDVLRAFADGKAIEMRSSNSCCLWRKWQKMDSAIPMFDFVNYEYRIKNNIEVEILELKLERIKLKGESNRLMYEKMAIDDEIQKIDDKIFRIQQMKE